MSEVGFSINMTNCRPHKRSGTYGELRGCSSWSFSDIWLLCLLAFASDFTTPTHTHFLLEVLPDYPGQNPSCLLWAQPSFGPLVLLNY